MSPIACEALFWLDNRECPFYGNHKHSTVTCYSEDAGFLCHKAAEFRDKIKAALSKSQTHLCVGEICARNLQLSVVFLAKNCCPEQ